MLTLTPTPESDLVISRHGTSDRTEPQKAAVLWLCPIAGLDPMESESARFLCLHSARELLDRAPTINNPNFNAVLIDTLHIEPLDYDPAVVARLAISRLGLEPDVLAFILRPDIASDPLPAQGAFGSEIFAMFANRPKLVVQLGAPAGRGSSDKDPDAKPSEIQRITRGDDIADYIARVASGSAFEPRAALPEESCRLVRLMLESSKKAIPGSSFSPCSRAILLSLAGSGAPTARALSQATGYSENTVSKAAREIALRFCDPNSREVPRGNWTFAVCDELAKQYRPWLQSLATREGAQEPVLGLASPIVRPHTQTMAIVSS